MSYGVETERRALLTPAQRRVIIEHMNTLGQVVTFRRINIEYSDIERQRSIKIRVNDGKIELVAKTGKLEEETRMEANLSLNDSLEDALNYLAIMGYTEALVHTRNVTEVNTELLNISVRDVIVDESGDIVSTMIEVEPHDSEDDRALSAMDQFVIDQDLERLQGEPWKKWVHKNHTKHCRKFSHSAGRAEELSKALFPGE